MFSLAITIEKICYTFLKKKNNGVHVCGHVCEGQGTTCGSQELNSGWKHHPAESPCWLCESTLRGTVSWHHHTAVILFWDRNLQFVDSMYATGITDFRVVLVSSVSYGQTQHVDRHFTVLGFLRISPQRGQGCNEWHRSFWSTFQIIFLIPNAPKRTGQYQNKVDHITKQIKVDMIRPAVNKEMIKLCMVSCGQPSLWPPQKSAIPSAGFSFLSFIYLVFSQSFKVANSSRCRGSACAPLLVWWPSLSLSHCRCLCLLWGHSWLHFTWAH